MHGGLQYDFLNDYDAASYKDKYIGSYLFVDHWKRNGPNYNYLISKLHKVDFQKLWAGPNSVRSGAKKFSMSVMPGESPSKKRTKH